MKAGIFLRHRTLIAVATITLGLALTFGLAAMERKPQPLRGTFASTCAPYDGPAFEVGLYSKRAGGRFWLRAMAPLKDAVGTWRTSAQLTPGDGWIGLCRKAMQMECRDAETGSFTVARLTDARMEGWFEAKLEDGRRFRHSFVATPAPTPKGRAYCG